MADARTSRWHGPCCALALWFFSGGVSGCHSISFGTILEDASSESAPVQAWLGQPVVAAEESTQRRIVHTANSETEQVAPGSGTFSSEQIIDLNKALRWAGAVNPTIAIADEAIRARLAERMQARALLFPTLNAGGNLRLHGGPLLSGRGAIVDVSLQSMYGGFGADARGGGTVGVPGVRLVSHLGDAYYAPKAAEQKVVQSRLDATATRSYILADVGVAYLKLVEAHAQLEAYRQSFIEFVEIERITTDFAKKGQGREADAERARSETLLLRAAARRSEEAIGVAAAELAQLLDRDPSVSLRPVDVTPPLLEFAESTMPMDQLDQAAANHPEVIARAADILFQEIRLKQERMRPLLPVVAVGFSAGEFGGGGNDTLSHLGQFHPRTDLDVVAVWSLQNFGFGNRAVQNVSRAELEMAHAEYIRVFDRVRREIVEARARIDANRQDITLAQKRVQSSQNAYTQDLVRARNAQGRPLEVLNSAALLATARQDLVRAMTGFSQAQLQLIAALGMGQSARGQ